MHIIDKLFMYLINKHLFYFRVEFRADFRHSIWRCDNGCSLGGHSNFGYEVSTQRLGEAVNNDSQYSLLEFAYRIYNVKCNILCGVST